MLLWTFGFGWLLFTTTEKAKFLIITFQKIRKSLVTGPQEEKHFASYSSRAFTCYLLLFTGYSLLFTPNRYFLLVTRYILLLIHYFFTCCWLLFTGWFLLVAHYLIGLAQKWGAAAMICWILLMPDDVN